MARPCVPWTFIVNCKGGARKACYATFRSRPSNKGYFGRVSEHATIYIRIKDSSVGYTPVTHHSIHSGDENAQTREP